jgi:hypothetical protein
MKAGDWGVGIVELIAVKELEPFDFRWPEDIESFEGGWSFEIRAGGKRHTGRHGIGAREVFGRARVHTVTWMDGEVQVEGVEADDYPSSSALISRLRLLTHRRPHLGTDPGGLRRLRHRRASPRDRGSV